eukprot:gene2717-7642_t
MDGKQSDPPNYKQPPGYEGMDGAHGLGQPQFRLSEDLDSV